MCARIYKYAYLYFQESHLLMFRRHLLKANNLWMGKNEFFFFFVPIFSYLRLKKSLSFFNFIDNIRKK